MFADMNYKTRFGLALIGVFVLKIILSVIMRTGFDPMLVGLNGVFLASGVVLILWGLYEKKKDGTEGHNKGD